MQALTAERDGLLTELQQFRAQHAADSKTSHQPPSTDKPWKPKSERPKSEHPSGGQNGHTGKTLELSQHPDEVIVLPLAGNCPCGHSFDDVLPADRLVRQVHDLPEIRLQVTEYQAEVKVCPHCTQRHQASFPESVPGQVQYGPRVHGLAVYLNTVQFVPLERTSETIAALCGAKLSDGTIALNLNLAFERLQGFEAQLKTALKAQPVLHADETGSKVNGKLHWLHVVSSSQLTLYGHHHSRGYAAMEAMGVLPLFQGTLMHDALRSYFRLMKARHALCNVHLVRELRGLAEHHHQDWAKKLRTALLTVYHEGKAGTLTAAGKAAFGAQFDELVNAGLEANPAVQRVDKQRGRVKQTPGRNVALRCQRYRQEMLRFLDDEGVPFDNNLAERDIRMMCVKRKVSGGFRSALGGEAFCRIRSYTSTLRKQNLDVWGGLISVFAGAVVMPNFGG